ncbi:MAG: hypothetical protein EHM35_18050, partial [Planctomycetaceae bacterium]
MRRRYDYIVVGLCLCLIAVSTVVYIFSGFSFFAPAPGPPGYTSGVRDNFDFDRPAADWSAAARQYGGSGLVDIVVAQARDNHTAVPFPVPDGGGLCSISLVDVIEPYLSKFDAEGLEVILSVQPMSADVAGLI